MKTFTMKLGGPSLIKNMREEIRQAIRTGVPSIDEDVMLCESVEGMSAVISKSRLEAFGAIVQHRPKSLKELAEILKKDLGNVSRDVEVLKLMGLIEVRSGESDDPRALMPVAKYDQIVFDFRPVKRTAAGKK